MTYYLAGNVVNFVTVIRKHTEKTIQGKTLWVCLCMCGKEFTTVTDRLTPNPKNKQQTCGKCEFHINHKDAYISWMSMNSRCLSSADKDYVSYGGRGITVCSRWHHFQYFLLDMGDPPKDVITGERLSIDRIDVNAGYSPNNCKWSTRSEQQRNKRCNT